VLSATYLLGAGVEKSRISGLLTPRLHSKKQNSRSQWGWCLKEPRDQVVWGRGSPRPLLSWDLFLQQHPCWET
jgi:hypothetical protein